MKKQVLLSVFAASLFAATPAALAVDNAKDVPNNVPAEEFTLTGEGHDLTFDQVTPAPFNKKELETSKAKTARANGVPVTDYANRYQEGKLVGKGKAAANKAMAPKAGAKPAGKVLPKTSAAK